MGIEVEKESNKVEGLSSSISKKIVYEMCKDEGVIFDRKHVNKILNQLIPYIEEGIIKTRMSLRLHDYLKTTGI